MTDASAEMVAEALSRVASGETDEQNLPGEAIGLVGALISRNYREYAANVQSLLESCKEENAALRAELAAVRELVTAALSGRHMPTSTYLTACLYPVREEIVQRIAGES